MTEGSSQLFRDRSLAKRVAKGDGAAFDEFFREYFPRLFRFTLTRTGNDEALAEEIVQQTMCQVVRKIGSYRGEALLFTWLCQICRNETAAIFRKRGLEQSEAIGLEDNPAVQAALESMSGDGHRPDAARRQDEIARFVRVTLEYLPGNYATALEMKYIHGNSVDEIGEALGIGSKAAESVLSRARSAFREGFRSLWNLEPDFLTDG